MSPTAPGIRVRSRTVEARFECRSGLGQFQFVVDGYDAGPAPELNGLPHRTGVTDRWRWRLYPPAVHLAGLCPAVSTPSDHEPASCAIFPTTLAGVGGPNSLRCGGLIEIAGETNAIGRGGPSATNERRLRLLRLPGVCRAEPGDDDPTSGGRSNVRDVETPFGRRVRVKPMSAAWGVA